jgi:hypothetical protein
MWARELKTGARDARKRSKGRAVLPRLPHILTIHMAAVGSTSKETMTPILSFYQFVVEIFCYFLLPSLFRQEERAEAVMIYRFEYVNYEHFL